MPSTIIKFLTIPARLQATVAKALAEKEYDAFRVTQDQGHESDFDALIAKAEKASDDK